MITEDQTEVVQFLESPTTYGNNPVERIDTHTAVVFLAGERAFKLKRAVKFDYLDFSTSERRRVFCDAELRLNRRTAPALYRRVVAITREPGGSLALDGAGVPVDWVVEMARFPQDLLFDRLAASGGLDIALMTPLGEAVAAFHREAERTPTHGGLAGMTWVVDGNEAGFAEFGGRCVNEEASRRLTARTRLELEQHSALLESRRAMGFVRHCHGDLHLGNIVLLDGLPTLFDGVEFNDDISCIDVVYDLAFLLMDLWHRELPRHANAVLNRYLSDTDDFEALPLLPLFLSCRAAVRAKTSATAAPIQTGADRREALEGLAREYFSLAGQFLHVAPPSLVAIGGFSGTGKSTLARGLAPSVGRPPGAIVLRSDELRKRLCGVKPLDRLGPEGYTPAISAHVYSTLAERARQALRSGQSVIVDAVYAHETDRLLVEELASELRVRFIGLWLDAAESTLVSRVTLRRHDASDADAAVVRGQQASGTGAISWKRIDASTSPDRVLQIARNHVD